jgi:hypothetical protein
VRQLAVDHLYKSMQATYVHVHLQYYSPNVYTGIGKLYIP